LKISLQKFVKSEIESLFRFTIPFVLILQLTLSGFAFSFETDGNLEFESNNLETSVLPLFCIEDVEDKSLNLRSLSLNIYEYVDLRIFSVSTNPPGNYLYTLNHSRSPPLI